MSEQQMFAKFSQAVVSATKQGKTYRLVLTPLKLTTLHGAIALAMKHPKMQTDLQYAQQILTDIRKQICALLVEMGFTPQEVEWLDKREV